MDGALASFIYVYLSANEEKEKKEKFESLGIEVANLAAGLLEGGESVDGFFDFFLNVVVQKNYLIQVLACQILYKLFTLETFRINTIISRKVRI
jgi:hypothetical protein